MNEVNAGELRDRLTLQAPVRVPDGAGGVSVNWESAADVWGAVRPIGGREIVDGEGLSARVTHEIWIRFRDGLTSEMRFRLDARLFDIRAVIDAGSRHRFLRCLVEERSR